MLTVFNSFDTLAFLWFYTFFYNMSIVVIFWIVLFFNPIYFKNLINLKYLNGNFFYLFGFTVSLFSLAGIPPFSGFFTKLILLKFFTNSYLLVNFLFLFCIVFMSLYFYVQNIRYLYNQNTAPIASTFFFNKIPTLSTVLLVFLLTFLTFGCFYLDMFLTLFTFLLSV